MDFIILYYKQTLIHLYYYYIVKYHASHLFCEILLKTKMYTHIILIKNNIHSGVQLCGSSSRTTNSGSCVHSSQYVSLACMMIYCSRTSFSTYIPRIIVFILYIYSKVKKWFLLDYYCSVDDDCVSVCKE